MPSFQQQNRLMEVTTPMGKDALLMVGFNGTEGVSQLFRYTLDLIAEKEKEVSFDKLVGQAVTVRLDLAGNKGKRYWNGICAGFGKGETGKIFSQYQMVVVPKIWLLTHVTQSRIFQQINVPDILKKVLKGYDVEYKLVGTFEKREYCVQYRETDFNFASRLMEEEGIYYYFKHDNGSHKMVVANTPDGHEKLPNGDKLVFHRYERFSRSEDNIYEWCKKQELTTGKATLWDHHFQIPHKKLDATKPTKASVKVGEVTHKLVLEANAELEMYDYPGRYAQRFDGIDKGGGEQPAELAKVNKDNVRTCDIRIQEQNSPAVVIHGASACRQVQVGHKFTFDIEPDDPQGQVLKGKGDYVFTSIQHSARVSSNYMAGEWGSFSYNNTFTCIPYDLPFRPPRKSPKPIIHGTQTAVVTGPSGEEIFTDKYGRIKVQLHWDREGKYDGNSSCWLRVASTWCGRNWGFLQIPRIGQEVIVDFLEGDPDRPIVIGSVWNPDQMPAYKLPDEKTKSYVKTNSSLGGVGYNEIRFEDKKGQEQIYIHGERNVDIRIRNEKMEIVNNHSHLIVGGVDATTGKNCVADHRETIWQDRHTNIKRHKEEHIEGSMKLMIGHGKSENPGNLDIVIEKVKKELIEDDSHLHVKKNWLILIDKVLSLIAGDIKVAVKGSTGVDFSKDAMTKVGGSSSMDVGKDSKSKIGGTQSLDVGKDLQEKVGKNYAMDAGTEIHLKGGQKVIIEAGMQLSLKGPGGFIDIGPAGVTIQGTMVKINSGGSAGSGSGSSPQPPQKPEAPDQAQDAAQAKPTAPTVADKSQTGSKSCN
jgi:type VI secretion system secreted protein VgrG